MWVGLHKPLSTSRLRAVTEKAHDVRFGNEVLPFLGLPATGPLPLSNTTSSMREGPGPKSNHVALWLGVLPGFFHSVSRADSVPSHQLPLIEGPFLPTPFAQKNSSPGCRPEPGSQPAEPGRCCSTCPQCPPIPVWPTRSAFPLRRFRPSPASMRMLSLLCPGGFTPPNHHCTYIVSFPFWFSKDKALLSVSPSSKKQPLG